MATSTVQQIIDKVDNQYRNIKSDAYKIDMINEAMLKLYDGIGQDHVFIIQTTAGLPLYKIDDSIAFDQISSLTVSTDIENPENLNTTNHEPYLPIDITDELVPRCYFKAEDGILFVYPTPEKNGQVIRIYYQSRATVVDSVDDIIELDKDYSIAIVYYVLMKIAESNDDIIKRNNFMVSFDDEVNEAEEREYSRQGKYPSTRDVGKPRGKQRRVGLLGNGVHQQYTYRG